MPVQYETSPSWSGVGSLPVPQTSSSGSTMKVTSTSKKLLPSKRAYKKSAARLSKLSVATVPSVGIQLDAQAEEEQVSPADSRPSELEQLTSQLYSILLQPVASTPKAVSSEEPLRPVEYVAPTLRYPEDLVDAPSRVAALYNIDQAAEATLASNVAYQSRLLAIMDRVAKAIDRIEDLQVRECGSLPD